MSPLAHGVPGFHDKRARALIRSARSLARSRDFAANKPVRSARRLTPRQICGLRDRRARATVESAHVATKSRDFAANEPVLSSSRSTLGRGRRTSGETSPWARRAGSLPHGVPGLWKKPARSLSAPETLSPSRGTPAADNGTRPETTGLGDKQARAVFQTAIRPSGGPGLYRGGSTRTRSAKLLPPTRS